MQKELITNEELFEDLIERIRAIISERTFRSRMEFIEGKHEVGVEMIENPLYEKGKWGARKLIKKVADRLGRSEQDIYYCVQFASKFIELSNALETLPDPKTPSWRGIIALLPESKEPNIPLPKGKYEILYADPPWEYPTEQHAEAGKPPTGGSDTHYRVMSDDKIAKLKDDIDKIAAPNCLIFMWATGPKMDSALMIGEKWGFDYSTVGFVWYKELPNPGVYTMSECEYCLIFRKGNIPQPRGDRNIRQFLSERRQRHSRKPDEIRKRIELMFPTQKKIQLFAREKFPNWENWGDEI